jgi:hypothetical protein
MNAWLGAVSKGGLGQSDKVWNTDRPTFPFTIQLVTECFWAFGTVYLAYWVLEAARDHFFMLAIRSI